MDCKVNGCHANRVFPRLRIAAGLLLAVLLSVVWYGVFRRLHPQGPEALLKRADDLSWLNSWIQAEPLYHQAELEFLRKHDLSEALYAHVSQIPAQSESTTTIPNQIATLRLDLASPGARIRKHVISRQLQENRAIKCGVI